MSENRQDELINEHDYFEVGNGSRRTLRRVPEMMDTSPIQNNYAFIFCYKEAGV